MKRLFAHVTIWTICWLLAVGPVSVFGHTSSNAVVSDLTETVYLPIVANDLPLIGYVDMPWPSRHITVVNGLAYVGLCERSPDNPYNFHGGLQIVDISNPANPSKLGSYFGSVCVWEVAVGGRYAYAVGTSGNHIGGMMILDISDPTDPFLVSTWSYWNGADEVAVADEYVYVGVGAYRVGLLVLDVSTPTTPTVVRDYSVSEFVEDLLVDTNHVYLAATDGLHILNRTILADIGFSPTSERPRSLLVQDEYAYVASDEGLRIVDISDLANPTEIGYCDITTDYSLANMAIDGNYLYFSTGTNGVRILDVSAPETPVEVGFYSIPGEAHSVAVDSNYAYVAHSDGVSIFALYRPEN